MHNKRNSKTKSNDNNDDNNSKREGKKQHNDDNDDKSTTETRPSLAIQPILPLAFGLNYISTSMRISLFPFKS